MKRFAVPFVLMMSLAATGAQAGTINVLSQNKNIFKDENGKNAWAIATKFSVGSYQSDWVGAGAFRLKDGNDLLEDFIAFCLEPLQPMRTPTDYKMGSLFSDNINEKLQVLAGNAMSLVKNRRTAAAFQMAAWEITTETSRALDINSGHFQITADYRRSNKSEALAQTWLKNIETGQWTAPAKSFVVLNTEGNQDLLTNIQPMPVPASSALLLSGLFGMGAITRRKKASS